MRKLIIREVECQDTDYYFDFNYDLEPDFIIHGNREYKSFNEDLVLNVLNHFEDIAWEYKTDQQAYLNYYDSLTDYLNDYLPKEKGKYSAHDVCNMKKLFERCYEDYRLMNDTDFIAEILSILKGKKMLSNCMKGYCQRDWQTCYYSEELGGDYFEMVEAYYFNTGCELQIVDTDDGDIDFSTDIGDYYDRDMVENVYYCDSYNVIDKICKDYDISKDNIIYYRISGYYTAPKYEQVKL